MTIIDNRNIDAVMDRVNVADAIERYTGDQFRNGKISCPFHTDKTPSLSVKDGRFRCWSCDESGSVIDFVRKMFNLSFPEAFQKIAKDFNVSLPVSVQTAGKAKKLDAVDVLQQKHDRVREQEIQKTIKELERENDEITQEIYEFNRKILAAEDRYESNKNKIQVLKHA